MSNPFALCAQRRHHRALGIVVGLCVVAVVSIEVQCQVVDLRVSIQPIHVCMDDGTGCANPSLVLNPAETDKIWQQAGIDVEFLAANQFNSSQFLNIGGSGEPTFFNLTEIAGHGQHADPNVLNLWFVNDIEGKIGEAWIGANGIAIDSGGFNRLDAIAHELGHNLSLDHISSGVGGANNLMLDSPLAPASINDIYPDGADLSFLTGAQIDEARTSGFLTVVPEPAETMAVAATVLLIWAVFRGDRKSRV